MKRLALAAALVGLTSCGGIPTPHTVPLDVVAVTFPATLSAGQDLTVNVKYAVGCNDENQRLLLVKRTSLRLELEASATNNGLNTVCPAIYGEATLTYADSGTVARSNPFEIVVNGKSWGKIEIK